MFWDWDLLMIYKEYQKADDIDKSDCKLSKNDGLIILQNADSQNIAQTRKSIIELFEDIGLKIEVKQILTFFAFWMSILFR